MESRDAAAQGGREPSIRNGAETARGVGEKSGPSLFQELRKSKGPNGKNSLQRQGPSGLAGGRGEKKSDSV